MLLNAEMLAFLNENKPRPPDPKVGGYRAINLKGYHRVRQDVCFYLPVSCQRHSSVHATLGLRVLATSYLIAHTPLITRGSSCQRLNQRNLYPFIPYVIETTDITFPHPVPTIYRHHLASSHELPCTGDVDG